MGVEIEEKDALEHSGKSRTAGAYRVMRAERRRLERRDRILVLVGFAAMFGVVLIEVLAAYVTEWWTR